MDELDRLHGELVTANERVSKLEDVADEDPLVPVLNRRGFERELKRVLSYVARYDTTATLVYIDLDDFKSVNDRYGHAGGDTALRHISDILLSNVRGSDIVGRIGGDEFAIVLHRADVDSALAKADALSSQVAASPARFGSAEIKLSMTTGVAEIAPNDTVQSILDSADRAMYQGKMQRNTRRNV
jgi:diguanylate cyclase (GGDEF)-like protein